MNAFEEQILIFHDYYYYFHIVLNSVYECSFFTVLSDSLNLYFILKLYFAFIIYLQANIENMRCDWAETAITSRLACCQRW